MPNLKTKDEIEVMAEGGARLAKVLDNLARAAVPGIETRELDQMARRLIAACGAMPAFLRYRAPGGGKPFPASICASVNDGVVHGVPSRRTVLEGDVLKIDIGLRHKGWCVDGAVTVGVGKISQAASDLIGVTSAALERAISVARPGNTIGDIGYTIQEFVEKRGFSVVDELTGHGVGENLHEDPAVPNKGKKGEGETLRAGMVIAIEPMVAAKSGRTKELPDGGIATFDGSLAAHFEHTVAITDNGPRVLTRLGLL
jgi:methionyl aminopeptidase